MKQLSKLCLVSLLASGAVNAQELKPEWELGAVGFAMSQQAYPGSSYQKPVGLIAPVFIYRGKFLRIGQSGLDLRALDYPDFELDVGFAGSFGSNSNKIPVRQGMPNLGSLVEFGPRAKWYLNGRNTDETTWVEMPIRGVFDINNRANWVGLTAEPQLAYEAKKGPWKLWASAGALLGNRAMNEHFYSVDSNYVTASRAGYQANAGLITWKAVLSASYEVSPALSVFGFTRLNTTHGAKNHNSPLVDKATGMNYGLGFIYTFMKSDTLVKP